MPSEQQQHHHHQQQRHQHHQQQHQQQQSDDGVIDYGRIPPELKALVRAAVEPLGCPVEAEAGIVNFYPADASMGGACWWCCGCAG
jgi:alkylated DNA repair dioxygenase AlkB